MVASCVSGGGWLIVPSLASSGHLGAMLKGKQLFWVPGFNSLSLSLFFLPPNAGPFYHPGGWFKALPVMVIFMVDLRAVLSLLVQRQCRSPRQDAEGARAPDGLLHPGPGEAQGGGRGATVRHQTDKGCVHSMCGDNGI